MPLRASGRRDQHRHAAQRIRVDHVDERLEQTAVARAEDRRDGDDAVGRRQRLDRLGELRAREAGQQVVRDVMREVAQFDHRHLGADPGVVERPDRRLREPVGEQPGRRGLAEPRRHDHDLAVVRMRSRRRARLICSPPRPAEPRSPARPKPASRAATRFAWVGASGTSAGRFSASSLRSTGTTSPPRMSSCSSTVFSGSPA